MAKITFVEFKDAAGNIYRVNPDLVRYLFEYGKDQKSTNIYFDSKDHHVSIAEDIVTVAKKLTESTT
jgi:hypothetical protein